MIAKTKVASREKSKKRIDIQIVICFESQRYSSEGVRLRKRASAKRSVASKKAAKLFDASGADQVHNREHQSHNQVVKLLGLRT
jgi:hypothetical protein